MYWKIWLEIAELKETVTVVAPDLALGSTKIAEVRFEPESVITTAGEDGQALPRSSLMVAAREDWEP